ncbi:MAG: helix-turn-helix domain-containing protein, partial [Polyangiaceae bacterium]
MSRVQVGGQPPFGTVLRRLRLAAGFSQEALAERAKMSTDAISALERGARQAPQRQTLALLIQALKAGEHER